MKQSELTAQILRLYIGRPCDVISIYGQYSKYLSEAEIDPLGMTGFTLVPHLRRLESITEDECKECYYLTTGFSWSYEAACKESWWREKDDYYVTNPNFIKGVPSAWLFLLSRGFDLFGLIDAKLAKEVSE